MRNLEKKLPAGPKDVRGITKGAAMKSMKDVTVGELHGTSVARGLTEEDCATLVGLCERCIYEAGETVVTEGDRKRDLLILQKGRIRIEKKDQHGAPRTLSTLEPPTVLGEIGLVMGAPRTATAIAETEAETLLLGGEGLQALLEKDDLAAYKISFSVARELAKRQNAMNLEALRFMERLAEDPAVRPDQEQELWDRLLKESSF